MNAKKPISDFIEENITVDYSERLKREIEAIKCDDKESLMLIVETAYKDGIKDGLKLALWLYE